jgi:uncharacterized protein YerC
MTIKEITKKYKNRWVLARIVKQDTAGKVIDAEPIKTAATRDEIDKSLDSTPDRYITVIYTGKIPARI